MKKQDAQWTCPEQKKAVLEALALKSDVLAIMRTGSGKSMIMILLSLIEKDRITVGILPLNSLIMDYVQKLQRMGVGFELYKSGHRIQGHHNLLLVSADKARTTAYWQAVAELNTRKPVIRIVFDEGHFAFTVNDFRRSLRDLYELRSWPLQMIVLSGTIPAQSESFICSSFGLHNPYIVCTTTHRPELEYILEQPRKRSSDILQRVGEIVNEELVTFSDDDRALIFVPFLDEGQAIAQSLQCDFYHGHDKKNLDSIDNREQIYNDWIKGNKLMMVCTSAFGAGNDYPHVRLVIHAGTPWSMIEYTQEKGRAGRDGKPAKSILLPKAQSHHPQSTEDDLIDHKGHNAMFSLLFQGTSTSCLRFAITSFCDDVGTSCHDDLTCQQCSGCLKKQSMSSTTEASIKNDISSNALITKRKLNDAFGLAYANGKACTLKRRSKDQEYVMRMQSALSQFLGLCAYCTALDSSTDAKHGIMKCKRLVQQFDAYKAFKRSIKYNAKHEAICWYCHVPQCDDQLHRTFIKGSQDVCEFPDIVVPVVYAMLVKLNLMTSAAKAFDQKWENIKDVMSWINSDPIPHHKSNLTAIFLWFYDTYM